MNVAQPLTTVNLARGQTMTDSNSTENWRSISGYEGLYEVSDHGRVRSLDHIVEKNGRYGNLRQQRYKGRILALNKPKPNKYQTVNLWRDGQGRVRQVHRLVIEAFVGPCPKGMECRHFPDGDTSNNRVENLSWGTRVENAADRVAQNTHNRGERNENAQLTRADIGKIFSLRKNGLTQQEISTIVGVCRTHIGSILRGERWAHTGHFHLQGKDWRRRKGARAGSGMLSAKNYAPDRHEQP